MCDICHSTPCLHGCPNEPEPERVYTCSHCGSPIYVEDEYMEFEGEYFHYPDCAEDAALMLLFKYGAEKGVASA